MQKFIKDVFGDYSTNSSLIEAEIENINLFKKTNRLQVNIISNKQINISEIDSFEDYLINRFKVSKASLDIAYKDAEILFDIENNWNNIIKYIGKKEPFSKAILSDSNVTVTDNKLDVNLNMKGASFLLSKKFDKGIEHLLSNLYNKNFEVSFIFHFEISGKNSNNEHS